MTRSKRVLSGCLAAAALALAAGCPNVPPQEFILGGTGDTGRIGSTASVTVLSPTGDLQITGGTPVEVNFRVVATTNFATVDIVFDLDTDPNNGNEFLATGGLGISASTALLNTSSLAANTYNIGVLLTEVDELAAFGYAPGRLIVNQRTQLFFTSPRNNFTFDRTNRVTPRFDVAWQLFDPDSTVTVEIFLDPDDSPNGNEIKLRDSVQQSADSFTFDFPVAGFEPGVYRILAVVSDGAERFNFYAPASITLRDRIAGYQDLRNLGLTSDLSGAVFEGFDPRDNLGSFVAQARDLDNDGFGEFLMMAQFAKPLFQFNLQRSGVGEAYLVYGRPQRFTGTISVNSIGRLLRGDAFTGVPEVLDPIRPSRGITSFTVLSDWDNDGLREFAFGVPFVDSVSVASRDAAGWFRSGAVVIASGSTLRPDRGWPGGQAINLALIGTEEHGPISGAQCAEGFTGPKAVTGLFGGTSTFYHRHTTDIPVGLQNTVSTLGARLGSGEFGDQFGETISTYDFDGIIISAPNRNPLFSSLAGLGAEAAGVVSMYSAAPRTGFYLWTNVNAPPANESVTGYRGMPANPFQDWIPHWGPYHYTVDEFRFGGFQGPDFPLIGAVIDNSPSYFVDRQDGPPCETFADPRAPSASSTTRFYSTVPGGRLSEARGIDDFNSDGHQDILIGQPLAGEGAGAVFIILGRLAGTFVGGELQVDELGLPLTEGPAAGARIFDGIRVVGAPGTRLGTTQDAAGDFNGDGVPDVVIGSPLLNNRRGGAAVFFGSRDVINLTQEELRLADLPGRGLGVIFEGEAEGDLAGARVAGVGDVDGDGIDDILIAAPDKSVRLDLDLDGTIDIDRTNCGVVYLIYGSSALRGVLPLADAGTERLPGAIFIGRNSGDFLGAGIGEQGDRSFGIATAGDVDGDGRRELLFGSVSATPRQRVRAGEVYLIYGR